MAAHSLYRPASHLDELLIVDLDQSSRVCRQLRALLVAQTVAEILIFPRSNDLVYSQSLLFHGRSPFCFLMATNGIDCPTSHLDELLIVDLDQSSRVCGQLCSLFFIQ